jgi:hypothetical protein
MSFLKGKSAIDLAEWLIGAALVIAVVGAMIFTVATNASAQGGKVGSWITSINVPASV